MLKTKAVERFIGQAVDNGVLGVILFNKEGQMVAQSGQGFNAKVFAALTSSLWETFDRQGNRDRLKEIEVRGENSNILAARVANMVIALISEPNVPLAICKAKLNQLVSHLNEPLGVIS
ncbi:hypothetical protein M3Y97_00108100 [Aphelenchoides bicaudatus]|nr:hypothetical protein M3Y97_00108100 [Aphelenchoides bicaudatus]